MPDDRGKAVTRLSICPLNQRDNRPRRRRIRCRRSGRASSSCRPDRPGPYAFLDPGASRCSSRSSRPRAADGTTCPGFVGPDPANQVDSRTRPSTSVLDCRSHYTRSCSVPCTHRLRCSRSSRPDTGRRHPFLRDRETGRTPAPKPRRSPTCGWACGSPPSRFPERISESAHRGVRRSRLPPHRPLRTVGVPLERRAPCYRR